MVPREYDLINMDGNNIAGQTLQKKGSSIRSLGKGNWGRGQDWLVGEGLFPLLCLHFPLKTGSPERERALTSPN